MARGFSYGSQATDTKVNIGWTNVRVKGAWTGKMEASILVSGIKDSSMVKAAFIYQMVE